MKLSCSLNVTECPLCNQPQSRSVPFNRCSELGAVWRYRLCRECGLVYQSPQMNDAELQNYYSADYWKCQGQNVRPDAEQVALQTSRAEYLLGQVPAEFRVERFLDIGCAGGFILRAALQRFQSTVVGVELSDSFRQFCQQSGLTVFPSTEALIATGEQRFDCVTMSHVLEHIRRPVEFLQLLRTSVLQPNGLLVLEVPNLYAHRSFEPAHPICFNETTLRATLSAAGFAIQSTTLHHHPRNDVDRPLYLTAVAAPLPIEPGEFNESATRLLRFDSPSPWLERVKRAYISKRGARWRQLLKATRIGVLSLFKNDLEY